jgi:hypothetical protein
MPVCVVNEKMVPTIHHGMVFHRGVLDLVTQRSGSDEGVKVATLFVAVVRKQGRPISDSKRQGLLILAMNKTQFYLSQCIDVAGKVGKFAEITTKTDCSLEIALLYIVDHDICTRCRSGKGRQDYLNRI